MVLALRIYQFQRPMQARCRVKVQANAQRMLAIKKANYKVKLRRKFDLIGVQSVARRNVPHIFPISHFHLPGPCRSVYVRVRSLPAQSLFCRRDSFVRLNCCYFSTTTTAFRTTQAGFNRLVIDNRNPPPPATP